MNFSKRFSKCMGHLCIIIIVMILSACAGQVKQNLAEDSLQAKVANIQAELKSRFERALAHQHNGEYSKAEIIYKSLVAENKSLISPVVNLGIIAVKQNKLDAAEGYFEKVVALDPNHKTSLNFLGYIARDAGAFDQSEAYYRKVLEIDPNDLLAIRNLGVLLDLYRGRLEEALVLYERYQSLQAEPDPKLKDWIFDTKNRLKVK
jgi:lipoprotein NlpI